MPVYEYTAINLKGKTVSGVIDAESSPAARRKLRKNSIFPVTIKEAKKISTKKESRTQSILQYFDRIKPAEISIMTRQLATLVGAGFPLVSAIDSLIPQTKSHGLKKRLAQIKDSIVEGNSFAAALSLYPGIFSSLYINMVSAGESSGTLEIVLNRLADITEKQQRLKNKIRSALAYPTLMCIVGTCVLYFLLTYVVPSISSIFQQMGQQLPTPTRILIQTSHFLKNYWWIIVASIVLFFLTVHHLKKNTQGRHFIDRIKLFTPGVGILLKKLAVARFARTLGSLLQNGVSLLASLEIVRNIVGNVLLADAVSEAAQDVGKGQSLGNALGEGDIFPSLSIQMIQVGEQTGELENMLDKIADVYEVEVESTITNMTALLEPIMILVMATVVGFIVLSVCLPIFEMNQLVK